MGVCGSKGKFNPYQVKQDNINISNHNPITNNHNPIAKNQNNNLNAADHCKILDNNQQQESLYYNLVLAQTQMNEILNTTPEENKETLFKELISINDVDMSIHPSFLLKSQIPREPNDVPSNQRHTMVSKFQNELDTFRGGEIKDRSITTSSFVMEKTVYDSDYLIMGQTINNENFLKELFETDKNFNKVPKMHKKTQRTINEKK